MNVGPSMASLAPVKAPAFLADHSHQQNMRQDPPPSFDSHTEFYSPSEHIRSRIQGQATRPANPFSENAETASLAPSTVAPSLPPYASVQYGIHRNEEEYLKAMRAWAEEKQYIQYNENGCLPGFFGKESLDDRSTRMKAERRAEKEAKAKEKARRGMMTSPDGQNVGGRRRSSVANLFRGGRRPEAA